MPHPTRTLGADGPQITALGVGLMSLGHAYGHAGSDEERLAFLDKCYELKELNWDTADLYGDSEIIVGKWFEKTGKRKEIFLATKFGFVPGDPNMGVRSDPEYVKESCERSLKRLGVDCIDLYYCHRVDGKTPVEKTVQAMKELKDQGKIKYLGFSEISSNTLRRAHAVHPISAVQIEYSPFSLDIESSSPPMDILSTCRELDVTIVAYSPLGRGFLTGSLKSHEDVKGDWRGMLPRFSEENFPKNLVLVDKIKAVAEKKGVTTGQVVLAWLMAQWEGIVPIPGTKRIVALEENVKAMEVKLTNEEIKEIRKACDDVVVTGLRYGHPGLEAQLFAETPEL